MRTIIASLLLSLYSFVNAQTLNIVENGITYRFPAAQAGDMLYADGISLTVMGRPFALSSVDSMYIDASVVIDNTVDVVYNGASASVFVAGNVARYVDAVTKGAHVVLLQSADLADEITYTLSGTSSDGSLYMDGSLKATFVLDGLTLNNPDSAAINIRDGKRIAVQLADNTESTLSDGANGTQKACFAVKGHTEFNGAGTLNIRGNANHAFWGKEYVQLKAGFGTLNILSAVGDGINCNQYYQQNGGKVTISGVGDDGIQASYETEDDGSKVVDEENTGQIVIKGGTIDINVSGAAAKGLTAESDIIINDDKSVPVITITTTGGGKWDEADAEAKASSCIKSDADITIDAGVLTLTSSGAGGKCLNSDSLLTVTGGSIIAKATGSVYNYTSTAYGPGGGGFPGGGGGFPGGGGGFPGGGTTDTSKKSSPKAIKSDGDMLFSGGTIDATSSSSEAIESKSCITIDGDAVVSAYSSDDAINSGSHMYIKGGTVTAYATSNDGLDANGSVYISGGHTIAYGAKSPECGIDANSEAGYTVYFTGGELIALGGSNSTPTNSSSTQCYVSTSASVTANSTVTLSSGSTTLATFTMPYSISSASILVTAPGMTSGSSYTLNVGGTSKSVSAVQYGSSRW